MAEIFLSYRRQDSASATGRIADRLEAVFGAARVFRDHESIAAGEDFAAAIRRAIEASTVLVVVIGRQWLVAALSDGTRRLDDPTDWVRLEIEAAFDADVPVVPVLVEGAPMPADGQLPVSLGALARCQAIELSDSRWRYDTDRLVEVLQTRFAIEAQDATATPSAANAALPGGAARLALDVLDLATHPTRLIARRQTGRAIDHPRAFLFLLGSLLAGDAMLLFGLNVHPSPSAIGGAIGGVFTWLFSGELIGVLMVALLAVPLTLAWRLAGRPVEYRRVTLVGAYVYSGAWLGFCGGATVMGLGFQFVDPGLFDGLVAVLGGQAAGAPAALDARAAQATARITAALHGPAAAMLAVAAIAWGITAVWIVVAWGAFRQAFDAGRGRAAAAALAWIVLLGAIAALALHLSA